MLVKLSIDKLRRLLTGTVAIVCFGMLVSAAPSVQSQTYVYNRQWPSPQADGIDLDASGDLVVTSIVDRKIFQYDSHGSLRGEWGSYGTGDGQFLYPSGVAVDDSGHVYVADGNAVNISKFTGDGQFLRKWGGPTQFVHPVSLEWHDGILYVSDEWRVKLFDRDGVFIRQWGSLGSGAGEAGYYTRLCVDPLGYVYVTDLVHNRVQKFSSSGVFVSQFGDSGSANGQFRSPMGITADGAGNVYVVDRDNRRIQKFNAVGQFVTAWGSYGIGDGELLFPADVAVAPDGSVFVSDDNRIQVFTPTGTTATRQTTWGRLKALYQ